MPLMRDVIKSFIWCEYLCHYVGNRWESAKQNGLILDMQDKNKQLTKVIASIHGGASTNIS